MAEILFTLSFDSDLNTVTVTDNGSDFDDLDGQPTSITVYIKTENKNSYVYKTTTDYSTDIAAFLNTNVGLVLTPDIFVSNVPDDFYVVSIIANEDLDTMMQSEWHVFTMTDYITEHIETAALAVNFPPTKLLNSLMFSMALQLVDLLTTLSDSADYTYERENKWHKIYNSIIIAVDEYKY